METLLHEFGHVLHGVLSRTRLQLARGDQHADGISSRRPRRCSRSGCGASSRSRSSRRSARNARASRKDDIARLEAARRYGQGIRYARQWLYAAFDMSLSTDPKPSLEVWKRMESATPLGHVEGTMLPGLLQPHRRRTTRRATTATCGRKCWRWTCSRGFSKDMLDPKVGRALPRHDPRAGRAGGARRHGAQVPRPRALQRGVLRGDHRATADRAPSSDQEIQSDSGGGFGVPVGLIISLSPNTFPTGDLPCSRSWRFPTRPTRSPPSSRPTRSASTTASTTRPTWTT